MNVLLDVPARRYAVAWCADLEILRKMDFANNARKAIAAACTAANVNEPECTALIKVIELGSGSLAWAC